MKKNGERYDKIFEQMELLGIQDVSTPRQAKNGTVVWQLPIKYGKDRFIEVASFKTGYVRNQNGGYTNYQLNKRCESEPQYYPEQKYNVDTNEHTKTGKYLKFTTRGCKLIPNEIDRLEYLIAYCLKNYYIKNANQVAEGVYVSKWEHEYELKVQDAQYDCGHYDRIKELESDVHNLENKLATIERIASDRNKWEKE